MSVVVFEYSRALLEMQPYPGVSFEESDVIRSWLQTYGRNFTRFEFGVRVGLREVEHETRGETIDRMWATITRPRPDLVALHDVGAMVIEAKVHATMRAVTQVRRYARLLAHDRPQLCAIVPMIVCRTADPGVPIGIRRADGCFFAIANGPRVVEAPA